MVGLDQDLTSADVLGTAQEISIVSLIEDNELKSFEIDLFDEYKKSGSVKFTTQFIWRQPDPPPNRLLDSKSRLNITIISASFLKDTDLIGK